MADEIVRVRLDGGVALLELDRPEAANAPDGVMAALLRDACADIAHDDQARVVLLTGVGPAFCVEPPPVAAEAAPAAGRDALSTWRIADSVAALPQPVVVALNGDAVGQGLELALAGDLRLVAESAHLSMPQVTWGALPWDGGTQRLTRVVGRAWALDMLLTGRSVSAAEAVAIGLVHAATPPEDLLPRAQELARGIAALAPIALRYTKEAIVRGSDLGIMDGLGLELDLNVLLHATADRPEGIASFLERRDPRFRGE